MPCADHRGRERGALDLQAILSEHGATSFDLPDTEDEAVALALARRPDVITSDVRLREGTGPSAVRAIIKELGPVPVIFITGTPEECERCEDVRILPKPLQEAAISSAFRILAAA